MRHAPPYRHRLSHICLASGLVSDALSASSSRFQPVRPWRIARPPYVPTAGHFSGGISDCNSWNSTTQLDFENFTFLTTDDLYWKAYLSSALRIAFTVGTMC